MPPPNSEVNSSWKCPLTFSNASDSRARPSLVEALDAGAELGDRRDQVVAVLDHDVELFLHLDALAFGPEINPAQPLALGLQPLDLVLDLRFLRQRVLWLETGRGSGLARLDVQRLHHLPLDLVARWRSIP